MSDLHAVKKQVSEALLKNVSEVVGVGLPDQGITVYLAAESSGVRDSVHAALAHLKLDVPIHFEVVGTFERQSDKLS